MLRRTALLAVLSIGFGASGAIAQSKTVPVYVGASIGQGFSRTQFFTDAGGLDTVQAQPLGWKALIGTRPLSFLGAELEYIDFGKADSGANGEITEEHARQRAIAASAVGYLPLPLPNLDVFGKLGAAELRYESGYSGNFPNTYINELPVGLANVTSTSSGPGVFYGVGAQVHFGALAVRAEFERISLFNSGGAAVQASANPSLLSVGLTWAF